MYHNDLAHRISLRLNDEQYKFIIDQSELMGVSPSNFCRLILNACMITEQRLNAEADKILQEGGMNVYENIKADKHDIIQ